MNESLRAALFTILDAYTFTPVAKVFDHVPQDNKIFPNVCIDTVTYDAADTDTSTGALFKITLRVQSNYKGGKECAELLDQLRDLLHHTEDFSMSGANVITVYVEGTTQEPNAENGELREGTLSLSILLDTVQVL